jgi:hypothetical protein
VAAGTIDKEKVVQHSSHELKHTFKTSFMGGKTGALFTTLYFFVTYEENKAV